MSETENHVEGTGRRSKNKTGSWCVYFTYKKCGEDIPQITFQGSEEQCQKYISDYNRQTLEHYRCQFKMDPSRKILDRIAEMKRRFGTVDE